MEIFIDPMDTLALRNLRFSAKMAGSAAEDKAQRKMVKQSSIINKNYYFVLFDVETMGPWSDDAIHFFDKKSKK